MNANLRSEPLPFRVWGKDYIDPEAISQMNRAMQLPISVAGVLMPDAHVGYGLPIGGVLATEGAVIPYAVGVDIACRMRLSVFAVSPNILGQQVGKFKNALTEQTLFGAGKQWQGNKRAEHAVLDDPAWQQTRFLSTLKATAYGQLGTSGSGNHFVEWGALTVEKEDSELGLKAGEYLALLSHSGSRGVGFQVAERFTKLANDLNPNLDSSIRHLAWLPLDHQLGYEYWLSMELAGRFAAANHEVIHQRIAKAAGVKPVAVVENHHNFAWKEKILTSPDSTEPEREVIIHRKGATPAGDGVLGIIPGSMGDAGFVVRGKGSAAALNSASHGAGRLMSRQNALGSITRTDRDRYLKERGVTLIGGDLDESPQAYKNIEAVMAAQADLVDIVGRFMPRIVRMDGKVK